MDRGSIPSTEAIPEHLERIPCCDGKNVFDKNSKKTGENETKTGKLETIVKTWSLQAIPGDVTGMH